MKTKNIFGSILILLLVSLCSCFKQKHVIKKVNPEFAKYVTGFTSGSISRRQVIRIELADQYGNPGGIDSTMDFYDIPDDKVLDGIFSFSPAIKGKAVWRNRRVIEFLPDEPLQPNQFYDVSFKLEKVSKVKRGFEEFEFQFSSFPQSLYVQVEGLKSYSSYGSEFMKLTGYVKTGDFEDTSKIKQVLEGEYLGKPLNIKWMFANNGREFYFYIDSIQKQENKQLVTLKWDGSAIQAFEKGSGSYEVPALGDFYVNEVNLVDEDDQRVELLFSERLQTRQNLSGILKVEGVEKPTYSIEGNVLKIYFDTRIVGDKEISIGTGIKNYAGYKMNEPYSVNLEFHKAKPKVRLFGSGSILPNSQGLIFPFEAVNLKKVDVRVVKILETSVHQFLQVNNLDGRNELSRVSRKIAEKTIDLTKETKNDLGKWNPFVIDLSKLITPEPGAIYRVSIKFNKTYAICDCEEEETEQSVANSESSSNGGNEITWNEDGWNSWGYDEGYDSWYDYYENVSPCSYEYYYGKGVSRNVLASNIGMIYKLDENKLSHAFVSDMVSTQPIEACTIEYYDFAKHLIAKGVTDKNGMLDLPLKSKPFLMIASSGKQKGYLKLQDAYANSMSKFDVDGEIIQKGIKGFFYGERGVWRPGDSLYLNFILEDKLQQLPDNYPVKFELRDPNGAVVSQHTDLKPVQGFYSFYTSTDAGAATGNYTAVAKVGNQFFYKTLMIETIKPNRLKIQMDLPESLVNSKMGDTIGKLSVKWLHGADAPNLNTKVEVGFSSMKTQFKTYRDYVFDSPLRAYGFSNFLVYDSKLDSKGQSYIKKTFDESNKSAGMLKANFITRVFEAGGDFSTERFSITYSPFRTYLGMQLDDKDEWLSTGKQYPLNLIAVNEQGKSIDAKDVELKLYKLEWRWWYESDNENLSDFVSRSSAIILADTLMQVSSKGSQYKLYFGQEEYGRYLLVATDRKGGHQTGMVIHVDWGDWGRGNKRNNENAKMLSFSIDKEKYQPGDNMQLTVPSNAGGKILVTIENSKKVLFKQWYSSLAQETRITIPVKKEMTPNAYVHVSMVQPHIQTKNDLPIRMYGVIPFTVDDPVTHIEPVIASKDEWAPESEAKVTVSEKRGIGMSYTLAIVDDGLLDLTRFKTPQPWHTFYAKEALGVKTWDMYDQVIGAYSGKLDKLISIGGDGSEMNPEGAKANRFKPMVRFMGPYYLAPGKKASHNIQVPSYIGSVRVMVIAGNDKGAYGNIEKTIKVKKPLMVLATLPRVLGPGETIQLPVDVFAMEDRIKKVKVRIETNQILKSEGESEKTIEFVKTGDEIVNFKLKVKDETGLASVRVIAECGSERTVQEIELDVRASNPKVVETKEMVIGANKSGNSQLTLTGIKGTNKVVLEVSRIPSFNLSNRLDYIIQYPHGCIEQTTSSVFPQLFVQTLLDLDKNKQTEITRNVKAAIKRLQMFQTGAGGFSYWPGESHVSEWGTNYAGHFLIEAEKQGYVVPAGLKSRWIKYQTNMAKSWNYKENPYDHYYASESYLHTQSYRLYTLALAGSPELGSMNKLREERNLSGAMAWRLAASYELIGQHEVALQIIKNLKTSVNPYREYSYTFGSDFRDQAMILETMSLLGQEDKAVDLAAKISGTMGSDRWLSTQETAYGLIALCSFSNLRNQISDMSFKVNWNGKELHCSSKKKIYLVEIPEHQLVGAKSLEVINNSKSNLYVKVLTEGVPMIGDSKSFNNHITMTVVYKDLNGQIIDVNKLSQGKDFLAEVTIVNTGKRGHLREMALTQIFPSGWEIRNERFLGENTTDNVRYKDYRDDRVYSYYDLPQGSTTVAKIRLNATYLGRFYLPTVYTEAMYDKSVNASQAGRWIEVVPFSTDMAKR